MKTDHLLEIKDLKVEVLVDPKPITLLDEITLSIKRNEIFGLAGESGSGKSTLVNSILRILKPPGVISKGEISFENQDLLAMDENQLRQVRWKEIAIVFQSAMNALNPVVTIGDHITETILTHDRVSRQDALKRAKDLLDMIGIDPIHLNSYPYMLSGGMKQRVGIAIALCLNPTLLIMDEPTTALDVIVQKSIMEKIKDLQRQRKFSIMLISHDLPLMLNYCDRVGILYAGRLVEFGDCHLVRSQPHHPYTKGLIESFPHLSNLGQKLYGIPGKPPHPSDLPGGCAFHPRCQYADTKNCQTKAPDLAQLKQNRYVACHHPIQI